MNRIFPNLIIKTTFGFLLFTFFLRAPFVNSCWSAVVQMTTEDLVQSADIIVSGTILETSSAWTTDRSEIISYIQLSVDEWLIPQSGPLIFDFYQPGGEADGIAQVSSSAAVFKVGESVVIFMRAQQQAIIGGFQGKYSIRNDIVLPEKLTLTDFKSMLKDFLQNPPSQWSSIREHYTRRMMKAPRPMTVASVISSFTPLSASGGTGTIITITGSNFGTTQGNGIVEFTRRPGSGSPFIEAEIITWSDTEIKCLVPIYASSGPIQVTNNSTETGTSPTNFELTYGFGSRKWGGSNPTVTYLINANTPDIPGTGERTAITNTFSEWNINSGAQFSFTDGGNTNSTSVIYDGNNIIFWGNIDGAGGTLARNTYWYYPNTGTIIESDIEFDDGEDWSLNPESGEFDVETVTLHELGHTFNFYDYYHPDDASKVMYGYSSYGSIKRSITDSEKDGAKAIYGFSGQTTALSGGNWLELAANSDFASTPDAVTLDVGDASDSSLTIEAWIYPTSAPSGGNEYIIAAKSDFSSDRSYELVLNSSRRVVFRLSSNGSSVTTLTSSGTISLDTWTHVSGVFDNQYNNTMFIFINSVYDNDNGVGGYSSNVFNSTAPFVLGGYSGGSEFVGRIDEVRLSSIDRWLSTNPANPHAIPPSFHTDNYTRGLWKFNEISGSFNFLDHSANGNNSLSTSGLDQSLPVQLSTFTAQIESDYIVLTWVTQSEINNDAFILERTSENIPFRRIAEVCGQGNSNQRHEYLYIDQDVEKGLLYQYRLADRDFSGNITYHPAITVEFKENVTSRFQLYPNYPNPFNPNTIIEFNLPKTSQVTLTIFNILGEEVATLVSDRLAAGNHSYEWSRPAGMASGVYLYRLEAGDPSQDAEEGFVETRKMLLMQ